MKRKREKGTGRATSGKKRLSTASSAGNLPRSLQQQAPHWPHRVRGSPHSTVCHSPYRAVPTATRIALQYGITGPTGGRRNEIAVKFASHADSRGVIISCSTNSLKIRVGTARNGY